MTENTADRELQEKIEDWLDNDAHSNRLPVKFNFSDIQKVAELLTPRILNLIEAEVKAGMLRQRAYDERKIEAERREAGQHELESIKRAVKNAEVNFEFDDARQTKTARTVVNVALELLRPQILEAINERIAHLTKEEGKDGEWTETWTKES